MCIRDVGAQDTFSWGLKKKIASSFLESFAFIIDIFTFPNILPFFGLFFQRSKCTKSYFFFKELSFELARATSLIIAKQM